MLRSSTRSRSIAALFSAGAVAAFGCFGATAASATASPSHPADHVVLLALDGFDIDYLGRAPMPNLEHLLKRGSVTTSTGVMTSITNPSWASIATGAWPEHHLNTSSWFDEAAGIARGSSRDIAVPTIAEAIRDQGGTVASAQWFIVQDHGTSYGDPGGLYTQPGGTCERRVDDGVAVLTGKPVLSRGVEVTVPKIPDLTAVYCDTLDAIGHDGGAEDARIPGALEMIDAQIGRLVQAAKDAGVYGRTTFVITGDHGMTSFTNGFSAEVLAAIAATGYQPEILSANQAPAAGTDVVLTLGGVADVHLIGDAANDPDAAARITAAVEGLPYIRAVYDKHDQRAMHMSPKHGELLIEPAPGWSWSTPSDGISGRHGSTTEMEVPLILAGAGVRPNAQPADPRHIDVAPTIAALLGYDAPAGAQGRVLSEAIRVR
ncbi:sulfatase-like hydrolase/transferase [Agromyces sp. CFH 90414]|uniref:Sulfatase-like hydrolase/transferase n=1 Tax=Agromyces agglutinans TaxID=2662258 RepID=A0A6I2FF02_9MICO|nr:alkaline phosphatase family protein [Agromyces agglutinans]MRG60473.1 sulfatase-like hydrolase/transferase [Agromyces agglutinans]